MRHAFNLDFNSPPWRGGGEADGVVPLILILYAGFSPAYPMKPKASSKKDLKNLTFP